MDLDKLKTEVLPKSKVFFDSIADQFNYREKHYYKFRILNSITGLVLFFMILSLIPATSYLMGEAKLYTDKVISVKGLNIDLGNFFTHTSLLRMENSHKPQ